MEFTQEMIENAFGMIRPSLGFLPSLPEVKFEQDKVTYRAVDLNCFSDTMMNTFMEVLKLIAKWDGVGDEINVPVPEDWDVEKVETALHNLMAMKIGANKRGRYAWSTNGTFVVSGGRCGTDGTKPFLTVCLERENALVIRNYIHRNHGNIIYEDLVIMVADAMHQRNPWSEIERAEKGGEVG